MIHYLQATLLKPVEMPVPAAKFEEAFGLSWKDALAAGSVYNALDAVSYFCLAYCMILLPTVP